jgi:ring-1,2-phenylacetyl-CoA epoxidase subunit PaaC
VPESDARLELLLVLADDELILGHRHSEWTGWAPYLEEDLAFSSIGQDEIGHARLLYEIAEPLAGRDPDALAFGRAPEEYRNAILCERPNGEWGYTIARQWLYDEWFRRLAGGPVEARQRLAQGLEAALPEAMALFEEVPGEDRLAADGSMPRSSEDLLAEWLERLGKDLEETSLDWVLTAHQGAGGDLVPTSSGEIEAGPSLTVPGVERREGRWVHVGAFAGAGGRRGRHSEDFAPLWEEMTGLYRAIPGATW